MKVLANDGISEQGIELLKENGFEVFTTRVSQEQLENYINEHQIDALLVKNNTFVREELIESCPSVKLIGKAGISMDNIAEDFARDNGLHIINTPNTSSNAIAELVFAHLFGMVRFLHQTNRDMPLEGDMRFKALKKQYSKGIELRGKTLGIIGSKPAALEVAKIALGIGMQVVVTGDYETPTFVNIPFFNGQSINIEISPKPLNEVLSNADFITLHTASKEGYVIDSGQIEKMKDGVGIINTSFGGALDEVALVNAINNGKVTYAGLDVYESEPTPEIQLLMNPDISFTPNIGANTMEAEYKMDSELAKQVIELLS